MCALSSTTQPLPASVTGLFLLGCRPCALDFLLFQFLLDFFSDLSHDLAVKPFSPIFRHLMRDDFFHDQFIQFLSRVAKCPPVSEQEMDK